MKDGGGMMNIMGLAGTGMNILSSSHNMGIGGGNNTKKPPVGHLGSGSSNKNLPPLFRNQNLKGVNKGSK